MSKIIINLASGSTITDMCTDTEDLVAYVREEGQDPIASVVDCQPDTVVAFEAEYDLTAEDVIRLKAEHAKEVSDAVKAEDDTADDDDTDTEEDDK